MSTLLIRVPVRDCVFLERLNRFVAKILVEGRVDLAHITNTGRLEELLVRGRRCKIAEINGKRLRYRLVALEDKGGYAVIDTRTQSRAFEEAVERGLLCFFHDCRIAGREPRVGEGRLDYVLECNSGRVLVETKSAVLRGPSGEAMYPDCPTKRGVRHVRELVRLMGSGVRVAIVFIAAFPGARCFKPFREGDPQLYEVLTNALSMGLEVRALGIYMDDSGDIYLEKPCLDLCEDWVAEAVSER
ncbi:MAG: DNA/RNA nuclease SfsA [Desulfurococcales archaeon]|nr:DNA/RNA nuclease SfsA [Desulfurococcales archaeon]